MGAFFIIIQQVRSSNSAKVDPRAEVLRWNITNPSALESPVFSVFSEFLTTPVVIAALTLVAIVCLHYEF
jgi:membrane-bound ClpP family serine protease